MPDSLGILPELQGVDLVTHCMIIDKKTTHAVSFVSYSRALADNQKIMYSGKLKLNDLTGFH